MGAIDAMDAGGLNNIPPGINVGVEKGTIEAARAFEENRQASIMAKLLEAQQAGNGIAEQQADDIGEMNKNIAKIAAMDDGV